jgi:septal ring factor EnvC (AmiA/AmiB activator)
MKKLIVAFVLLTGLIYLSPSEVMAQTVSTVQVDAKTQAKLEKAKEKLAKNKADHSKAVEKLSKMRADYDKKHSAGKLSPNDVEKITKKLGKQSKKIEKLEKSRSKLEEFIRKNS